MWLTVATLQASPITWLVPWAGIVVVVFSHFYAFPQMFMYVTNNAERDVREQLQNLLSIIGRRHYSFIPSDDPLTFICQANVDEIRVFRNDTKEKLDQMKLFNPVTAEGGCAGIWPHFLSLGDVKRISKGLQESRIRELACQHAMAMVVLGTDAEEEDNSALLAGMDVEPTSTLARLRAKREQEASASGEDGTAT